ncbi:hypothetical protein E4T47_00451 [Aureobasidium subglaciale]|nr:hypothetical protein E4T47_00451 [Aureobasidium subglaciale]
MPGITWDAEADRKILLYILKDSNAAATLDWDSLAADLSTETATCTVAALKKHLSRLRVSVKNSQDNGDGSESPVPKTPAPKSKAKGKGAAGSSVPSKGKGKLRPKRKVSDDSDDNDGTPLRKKSQKVAPEQEEQFEIKSEVVEDEA